MSFCKNCGKRLDENFIVCPYCGAYTDFKIVKTIKLRCKECGGNMAVNEGQTIIKCPYCGSSKIIPESDAVKVEKIRSNTYKEMEYKKWEREDLKARQNAELDELKKYKKSKFGIFTIVCAVISALCFFACIVNFSQYFKLHVLFSAFISMLQLCLFIISALIRNQIIMVDISSVFSSSRLIKLGNKSLPSILSIIGLILFIPLLMIMGM